MGGDNETTVLELRRRVAGFVSERRWERFHTPKNLAESICIEAAELLEIFQWVGSEESREYAGTVKERERVGEELADVVIYCLGMANAVSIDVSEAVVRKMGKNEEKYPKEKSKGRARA